MAQRLAYLTSDQRVEGSNPFWDFFFLPSCFHAFVILVLMGLYFVDRVVYDYRSIMVGESVFFLNHFPFFGSV